MDKFQLRFARGATFPDSETCSPHQVVEVDLFVNEKLLGTTRQGGNQFICVMSLLTLAGRETAFVLNCRCGINECARIDSPVYIRMAEGTVTWTFPREYRDILSAAGLPPKSPGEVSFVFERSAFEAATSELRAFALEVDTPELPAVFGEPVMFRVSPLQQRFEHVEALTAKDAKHTMASHGPGFQAYPVVPPISRAGCLPDFKGALGPRPGYEKGMRMGVGSIRNHLIYQYNFDDRSGRWSWSYVYAEVAGVPLPPAAP